MHIVREAFMRPGDETPTYRHYPVHAGTAEEALQIVKNLKPYRQPFAPGVMFGLVPGSELTVLR